MEWIGRMNGAIDYIENNLTNEIKYEKAAQIALCSVYNFQRMFFAGIPPHPANRCLK